MSQRNSPRLWMIALAVAGSMAIFIFVVWHAALTQSAPGELPIISAPSGPVRVAPELPGGMEIPNQKMTVFETFQEDPPEPSQGAGLDDKEVVAVQQKELSNKKEETISVPNNKEVTGGATKPESSGLDQEQDSGGGFFMVQLGSFGSLKGAEQGWERLLGRQEDIMGGLIPVISKVDLEELGTFYRLRTEIKGDREKAGKFCNIMLESNIECMVIVR